MFYRKITQISQIVDNWIKFNEKSFLLILFTMAFLIRLIFGYYEYFLNNGLSNYSDDWDYIGMAQEFLNGNFFNFTGVNLVPGADVKDIVNHRIPPGLPILLVPFIALFGHNYFFFILFNIFLISASIIAAYLLCKEVFTRHVALLSSLWLVFYWPTIRNIHRVLKEPLLIFLVIVLILFYIKAIKHNNFIFLFIASLSNVYLFHTDERFIIFVPVFLVGFFYLYNNNSKYLLKQLIFYTTSLLVLSSPWCIKNYIVYKQPVIVTSRLSDQLNPLLGLDPIYHKILSNEEFKTKLEKKWNKKEKTQLEIEFNQSGHHPYLYLGWEKYVQNIFVHWRFFHLSPDYTKLGYTFAGPWSLQANILYPIQWGFPLLFFFVGIYFLIKNNNRFGIFLFLLVLLHGIVHSGLFIYGSPRYRLPIDAVVIIIASYGLIQLYQFIIQKTVKYL